MIRLTLILVVVIAAAAALVVLRLLAACRAPAADDGPEDPAPVSPTRGGEMALPE